MMIYKMFSMHFGGFGAKSHSSIQRNTETHRRGGYFSHFGLMLLLLALTSACSLEKSCFPISLPLLRFEVTVWRGGKTKRETWCRMREVRAERSEGSKRRWKQFCYDPPTKTWRQKQWQTDGRMLKDVR